MLTRRLSVRHSLQIQKDKAEYGLKVPGATYHTERRMSMNFLCKCCKSRVTESKRPEYIESAAIHQRAYHMEWAVFDEKENSKPMHDDFYYFGNRVNE